MFHGKEPLLPFCRWRMSFTPVIPNFYWDSVSPEQQLLELCKQWDALAKYANLQTEQINLNSKEIEELKALFKKFQESGFDDYYKDQIIKWIDSHLSYIFDNVVKQVYFGLSLDGYFVAYVPDGWQDIRFDTGSNYAEDAYGRLILRWDVDNSEEVNQTREIVR